MKFTVTKVLTETYEIEVEAEDVSQAFRKAKNAVHAEWALVDSQEEIPRVANDGLRQFNY